MSKELEKYKKAIESFKNYIKTIENRQEYLHDNEDFYREEIEQNELFLKMLHGVSSYIDNSIPKEVVENKLQELEKEYKIALEENSTKALILKCQVEIVKELQILNYIDNSISKEAIEDAIKYEKGEIKYSTDEYRNKMHAYTLNVLEEILEGK